MDAAQNHGNNLFHDRPVLVGAISPIVNIVHVQFSLSLIYFTYYCSFLPARAVAINYNNAHSCFRLVCANGKYRKRFEKTLG